MPETVPVLPAAPRVVTLPLRRQLLFNGLTFGGIIMVAAGLSGMILCSRSLLTDWRLSQHKEVAEAEILSVTDRVVSSKSSHHTVYDHYYRFLANHVEPIFGTLTLRYRLPASESLEVEYDPEHPKLRRFPTHTDRSGAIAGMLTFGMIVLVGVGIWFGGVARGKKRISLLESGDVTTGTIEEVYVSRGKTGSYVPLGSYLQTVAQARDPVYQAKVMRIVGWVLLVLGLVIGTTILLVGIKSQNPSRALLIMLPLFVMMEIGAWAILRAATRSRSGMARPIRWAGIPVRYSYSVGGNQYRGTDSVPLTDEVLGENGKLHVLFDPVRPKACAMYASLQPLPTVTEGGEWVAASGTTPQSRPIAAGLIFLVPAVTAWLYYSYLMSR